MDERDAAVDDYLDYNTRRIRQLEKALNTMSAVMAWQVRGEVHPVVCGNAFNHKPLIGVWDGEKVILRCLDCDFVQFGVPPVTVCSWNSRLEKEKK